MARYSDFWADFSVLLYSKHQPEVFQNLLCAFFPQIRDLNDICLKQTYLHYVK